jgi:hypothetical protein
VIQTGPESLDFASKLEQLAVLFVLMSRGCAATVPQVLELFAQPLEGLVHVAPSVVVS